MLKGASHTGIAMIIVDMVFVDWWVELHDIYGSLL